MNLLFIIQILNDLNVYFLILSAFFGYFIPLPESYFSYKGNIFNVYFVKIGWFWTIFVCFCRLIIPNCNTNKPLSKQVLRIIIATIFWYSFTSIFDFILLYSGECSSSLFSFPRECKKSGYIWNGKDISGHTFLLLFSSLLLLRISRENIPYDHISIIYKILEGIILFVRILWIFMFFITFVYFHSLEDKILGCLFAIISYYSTEYIIDKIKL